MNFEEAKEKLRSRIKAAQADLEAIEHAEAAVARLSNEESRMVPGSFVGPKASADQNFNGNGHGPAQESPLLDSSASLKDIVAKTISEFPDGESFTKDTVVKKIAARYPRRRLSSMSSLLWVMANRGHIYTVKRGAGRQASIYRKVRPGDTISPSGLFDSPDSNSGGAPA